MAGKSILRRETFDRTTREKNGRIAKGQKGVRKEDARFKIMQKKRQKLVDARDRLAQMAKKTDARAKIVKLRQLREGIGNLSTETVRPVGSNILLKTDRNGKITLSTNKTKKSTTPTDMNVAIRKQLGLVKRQQELARTSLRTPARQVHPTYVSPPVFRNQTTPTLIDRFSRDVEMMDAFTPPLIQRTIRNDIIRDLPPLPNFTPKARSDNLYSWTRPSPLQSRPKSPEIDRHRPSVEVTTRNNIKRDLEQDGWNYADPSIRSFKLSSSSMYVDENIEDSPPHLFGIRLKTGIHSRLDTGPLPKLQSEGIFAQAKPKVVVPIGHRIVVSNLQPTVTQDDIRELFEDIGELLVSRLVRPGTAEVIYKNLKDAQKAVDTYHNRQLDGQPMKCLLVNKRPVNNPTAPALRTPQITYSSVLHNSSITKKAATLGINKSAASSSTKLMPDIDTIHKVLFHKT